MSELHAYSTCSGLIRLGTDLPKDALPLARGHAPHVRLLIERNAEPMHGSAATFSVPGMVGAQSIQDKLRALEAFRRLLSEKRSAAISQGFNTDVVVTNLSI
ncbi:hypothetical protein [Gilvimarinus agarilyticus]|uniref:hypothetical protein n=1 Tax=Gilvimarinus agarilyticus TaxID=679259 RepID=UPI0005A18852|nr:hypothetical protein [Gilvimarinus agarilyticus]